MKKHARFALGCLLAACYIGLNGCGPKQPKNIAFSSDWKYTTENLVVGAKDVMEVSIHTDGKKFRIENKHNIRVYDGEQLYTSSKSGDNTTARKISGGQLSLLEFWKHAAVDMNSKPGGLIAGRDTTLYGITAKRSDGEVTAKNWIDSENGVVLKTYDSIYSKQIEQMVTKETKECLKIEFGPVDEALFNRP